MSFAGSIEQAVHRVLRDIVIRFSTYLQNRMPEEIRDMKSPYVDGPFVLRAYGKIGMFDTTLMIKAEWVRNMPSLEVAVYGDTPTAREKWSFGITDRPADVLRAIGRGMTLWLRAYVDAHGGI